jgi:hypothetical protein
MTKTSRWAGYLASLFAIAFFITATTFRRTGGEVPDWVAVVTGWFMMLAAFSGVVCLVSAVFAACGARAAMANPTGADNSGGDLVSRGGRNSGQ